MKRALGVVGLFGVVGGFLVACGGESTDFTDHGNGDGGTTSSTGGSTATGGSKATGGSTGTGGSTSTGGKGGTAGTGGLPEPPDGVCEDITACGGDPQGTWNVSESCFEVVVPIFTQAGCENSPGAASVDVTGTFTFADGTLTTDLTTTPKLTVVIDDACAQALVMLDGITAVDVCPLVNAQLNMNPNTPGTCAPASGGCRCDVVQAPMPATSTDTYEIVGNQLVTSDGTTYDFCQDGDELHLHSDAVDVATSSLGGMTLLLDRAQ